MEGKRPPCSTAASDARTTRGAQVICLPDYVTYSCSPEEILVGIYGFNDGTLTRSDEEDLACDMLLNEINALGDFEGKSPLWSHVSDVQIKEAFCEALAGAGVSLYYHNPSTGGALRRDEFTGSDEEWDDLVAADEVQYWFVLSCERGD